METKMKDLLSLYDKEDSTTLIGIVNQKGRQIYSVGASDKLNIPIEDRFFEIGSISKVFTAILFQTMVSDKLVQLNDPVIKYEPRYAKAFSADGKEVTLNDLITHHANLPRNPSNIKVQDNMNPYASYEINDLDMLLSNHKLKKYKRKFKYSNLGVGILGNILAGILETDYEKAINSRICKPLGLHDTYAHLNDSDRQRMIVSYRRNKEIPQFSIPALLGAGVLKSTLNDMLTFLEANLGLVECPLHQILNQTHKIQSDIRVNNNTQMGLGWMVTQDKQTRENIHWHNGGTVGFNTYIGMKKEKKTGIIIATTQKHSMWKLIKILLGLNEPIADEIATDVYNYLSQE